jgi:hypothetical protein
MPTRWDALLAITRCRNTRPNLLGLSLAAVIEGYQISARTNLASMKFTVKPRCIEQYDLAEAVAGDSNWKGHLETTITDDC